MPPRRHPRSWLAGRLRSAAGAVQRLAGRVEPAGQLPPSEAPTAAPRRFGEPPQHWLDLVTAHAPGLLHDLDLDRSPVGSDDASVHDDRPGGSASIGPEGVDAAGPATDPAFDGTARADGTGAAGGSGPGASRVGGADGSRSPGATGRPGRRSRAADGADGTKISNAGPFGTGAASPPEADPPTGPDATTGSARSARSAGSDAAAGPDGSVRRGTGDDTSAVGGDGPPRAGEPPQTVRPLIRPANPDPLDAPTNHLLHRTDNLEPTRITRRATRAPRSGPPASTGADGLSTDRDGLRGGSADGHTWSRDGRPGATGDRRAGEPGRARTSRLGGATGAAPDGRHLDGPSLGRVASGAGSAGATVAAGGTTMNPRGDLASATGGGPWPALPDESARVGQPAKHPAGHPAGPRVTEAGTISGTWADERRSASTRPWSSVIEARVTDPWPALPDDATLWTVPGDALDAVQLSRLDREQAGD
ncbi:hypothetical protein [Micromonospora sp. LH3U1]|uniref:hypothetical protein n=1 Tax=Micromonospora sp. LH3U1 TaxID=3018339 RepID=UPI002349AF7C|nr:hypothetical protein [Micromonospora sp. LH3U1]WCN78877.1 hypothetical protein PCA76_17780 [Micromonospora sp. LH3U1]